MVKTFLPKRILTRTNRFKRFYPKIPLRIYGMAHPYRTGRAFFRIPVFSQRGLLFRVKSFHIIFVFRKKPRQWTAHPPQGTAHRNSTVCQIHRTRTSEQVGTIDVKKVGPVVTQIVGVITCQPCFTGLFIFRKPKERITHDG